MDKIGKLTISLLISSGLEEEKNLKKIKDLGYKVCVGKAGAMKSDIIIAAIETVARREVISVMDIGRNLWNHRNSN